MWAALTGLGAQALLAALLSLLIYIFFSMVQPRGSLTFTSLAAPMRFLSVAIGAAVALRSGTGRGLLGYLLLLTAIEAVGVAAGAPRRALFCERSGGCAEASLLDEISRRLPTILGALAGLALVRSLGVARRAANASLESIGSLALLFPIAFLLVAPFGVPMGEPAFRTMLSLIALQVIGAAIAGLVLVRRGGQPWPDAVIVAFLYFVGPWLPFLANYIQTRAPVELRADRFLQSEAVFFGPAAYALAFILASIVTAAFAPPRPPDADATRRAAR